MATPTPTHPSPAKNGAKQKHRRLVEEQLRTLQRVLTTPYPIAQTPKETIWTLNKAKLYHYIPVVPPEQRYPTPLLLVFALMNRSSILAQGQSRGDATHVSAIGHVPHRHAIELW